MASAQRRHNRSQQRLKDKIEKQFLERIKGKSDEQIKVMLERIRVKYNLDQFNKPEDDEIKFAQPID